MKPGRSVPDNKVLETWEDRSEKYAKSFFQTAAWASLLVRHFRQYSLAPVVSNTFFIPLIRERRYGWITDSLYGAPMMTRAGILADRPLEEEHWREAFEALADRGVGTIVLSLPPTMKPPILENGFALKKGSTHLLPLEGGWKEVQENFENRCGNAIRRAVDEGVQISRDESEAAVGKHWELASSRFEEWKPDPALTRDFIEDCVQSESGRLYLAEREGVTVASVLVFAYRDEVILWQGSRVRDAYPRGTDNLLFAKIVEEACAEGFKRVDFGGSLNNPGMEKFKDSFGAEKVDYAILKRTHPLLRYFKKG